MERFPKSTKWSTGRGQIAVTFALLVPVLLGIVGLVVDGGIAMVQFRRGQVTLDSAALAAATQLDRATFVEENAVELSVSEAVALATRYANQNGQGRVVVTGIDVSGTQVAVYGTVASPTIFMRIFGINQVRFDLSARAELTYGITEEGQ
ncbi:MAG: pilus assembly protein [Anaerolineales bacterium]|nr:pilus assembly protein [Anaerolineales bacterium]